MGCLNYLCGMKRIIYWLKDKWINHKLHKVRLFLEADCLARINQGQARNAGECAVEDWCNINSLIFDIKEAIIVNQDPSSRHSFSRQQEDK